MWRRKQKRPSMGKIERRLASQPVHEILGWAETSLFNIGRNLRGGPEGLTDAEANAEVLLAAIRELRARQAFV